MSREWKLWNASVLGDLAVAKEQSQNAATNVNWQEDNNQTTALYEACYEGHQAIVELLLQLPQLDLNLQTRQGATPLFIACHNNHVGIARLLLGDPRILVNLPTSTGGTPFYIACQKGLRVIVDLMVADRRTLVDVKRRDVGTTPLWVAAQCGHLRIVRTLLASGRRVDVKATHAEGTDGWCGKSVAEVAKWAATQRKWPWDAEEKDQAKRRHACPAIADLLLEYEKDPVAVRRQLREILKIVEVKRCVPVEVSIFTSETWTETYLGFQLPVCGSGAVPHDAADVDSLRSLLLIDMGLKSLPESVKEFKNLTELDLARNALTALPEFLCDLKNLTRLDVTENDSLDLQGLEALILRSDCLLEVAVSQPEGLSSQAKERLLRNRGILGVVSGKVMTELHITPTETSSHYFFAPRTVETVLDLEALDLAGFNLGPGAVDAILGLITNASRLRYLNLINTSLAPSSILAVVRALVGNLLVGHKWPQILTLDDIPLPSEEGLAAIPCDLLVQGTKKITEYVLDCFRAPECDPIYRTKLMVVGYESVGKTTILDCLFPLTGWLQSQGKLIKTPYWYKLQGRHLTKYDHPDDTVPHKNIVTVLENRQWEVVPLRNFGIKLVPKAKKERDIEFYCPDSPTYEAWLSRLKRTCMNEVTHGIEIRNLTITDELATAEYFSTRKGGLEMSVWDFAGQHDYYNNHHYFLSARSVFLVLWKMNEGEKGLASLEFWLKSLATHLQTPPPPPPSSEDDEEREAPAATAEDDLHSRSSKPRLFSVMVVGTFLDHASVNRDQAQERAEKIQKIAEEAGVTFPIEVIEVSCATLENLPTLKAAICTLALSHTYMGERVPVTYCSVECQLKWLLEQYREVPVVDIQVLVDKFGDRELVQRALQLLSKWGVCIYFNSPPDLASTVVLDPRFLTKDVLGQLFNPKLVNFYRDGIVNHSELPLVWTSLKDRPDFWVLAPTLVRLMEKFEVTFPIREEEAADDLSVTSTVSSAATEGSQMEDLSLNESTNLSVNPMMSSLTTSALSRAKPFPQGRSVIPSLLPDQVPADLARWWAPSTPFGQIQVEKFLTFNVVPKEMVGRLFVRLHASIEERLMWRKGMYFDKANYQALVTVDPEKNWIIVRVRADKSNRKVCLQVMEDLTRYIQGCSEVYPGVVFQQMAPSPSSYETLLRLTDCLSHFNRPETERALRCPKTRQLVNVEKVLIDAGMLDDLSTVQKIEHWWTFPPDPKWLQHGEENLYWTLEVVTDQGVQDEQYYRKLALLVGEQRASTCKRAYAVHNPLLLNGFEVCFKALSGKIKARENLFKKDDWKSMTDTERRADFLSHLQRHGSKFPWNKAHEERLSVVPMIQGTSEGAVWVICQNGFATVATLDDGFYGKGIYLTSSFDYATTYSTPSPQGKPFIVAMTIPGNSYPVTEHPFDGTGANRHPSPRGYYGKPCRSGYQSHCTIVDYKAGGPAYPIQVPFDSTKHADELVVFQDAQTLPLFVIYM